MSDSRIPIYRDAARALISGQFKIDIPLVPEDELSELGLSLIVLGRDLEVKFQEINTLAKLTESVNSSLALEDVLNQTYDSFSGLIPFDRLALALLDDNESNITSRWMRSKSPEPRLTAGYTQPLKNTSLQQLLSSRQPRILNNLPEYLKLNPHSESTTLIVAEGMRSSLTCPLFAMNKPIGILFFSSTHLNTYKDVHIELFLQIAGQLAMIVEKSRLYEELVLLNKVKSRFLGIAAHDLRNPIGSVISLLEIMQNGYVGTFSTEQMNLISRMNKTSKNMLNMLNELLDVTAIQTGKLKLEFQKVPVRHLCNECVEQVLPLAQAKNIEIILQIPDDLPNIEVDSHRIQQVLVNLLTNAVKYSFADTQIHIFAGVKDDSIIFAVQDQGQGIPTEDLDKIFSEFGRANVKPTGGESSTGLGLAIAKRMVQAHQGTIWLESEVGKGSIFYFSIPVHQPITLRPDQTNWR